MKNSRRFYSEYYSGFYGSVRLENFIMMNYKGMTDLSKQHPDTKLF